MNIGTVPGGFRDTGEIESTNRRERGLIRYAERKAAGEKPSSITLEGQEKDERKWYAKERLAKAGMLGEG